MDRDLLKMLDHIDPATLDYQEWLSVGMALKTEGYNVDDWEN
ncbi:MAG: PriCT-2 domain-containing protein, partial [Bacillota bacterium]|nr:PriCT-2 domain-containing protein [Bacillota bacterium]